MKKEGIINKTYIADWRADIHSIEPEEEVRVIEFELHCDLYRTLESDIREAIKKKNAKFKFIAGPVISIEEDTRSNAILELADEKLIELRISSMKDINQHRIFGYRFYYSNNDYDASPEEQNGTYSNDFLAISGSTYHFDSSISLFKHKKHNKSPDLIKLTIEEILSVRENTGDMFHFSSPNQYKEELDKLYQK